MNSSAPLGYLKVGEGRLQEIFDEDEDNRRRINAGSVMKYDDKLSEFAPLLKRLSDTMGDLARELRDLISGPNETIFRSGTVQYEAVITVGYLLKDDDKLRFRWKPMV